MSDLSWRQRFPEKHKEQRRKWHAKNPDKTREYNLRHKFNMSLEDYENLVVERVVQ